MTTQYHAEAIALLSANGYEVGEYNPHKVSAWLIQEVGISVIALGSNELEALDDAANRGLLDLLRMSPEDYREYTENGWDDSYVLAGNASEPFWAEYLHITKVLTA